MARSQSATRKKAATTTKPARGAAAVSPVAAKAALDVETKAIRKLQKDVARNARQIGRRLAQLVAMELYVAGGFASMEAYAEAVLGCRPGSLLGS